LSIKLTLKILKIHTVSKIYAKLIARQVVTKVIKKLTKHFIMPHNRIGFYSKNFEDMANKIDKIAAFNHPTFNNI